MPSRSDRATEALIVKTRRGCAPQLATSGGGFVVEDGGTVTEEREYRTINLNAGDDDLIGPKQTRVTTRTYEEGAVVADVHRVEVKFGVSGHGDYYDERSRKMVRRARVDDVAAIRRALAGIERARARYREAVARAWKRGRKIETKEEAEDAIRDAGFELKPWSVEEHPSDHPLVFHGGKRIKKL